MGKAMFAFELAKGFGVFWVVIMISIVLMLLIERTLKISPDTHFNAYVFSNLVFSIFIMMGWAAFVGVTLSNIEGLSFWRITFFDVESLSFWIRMSLYIIGFLSCYIAFAVLTSFYSGNIFKVVNLPLALVSYLIFAIWPVAGRMLYGWFFTLVGMKR